MSATGPTGPANYGSSLAGVTGAFGGGYNFKPKTPEEILEEQKNLERWRKEAEERKQKRMAEEKIVIDQFNLQNNEFYWVKFKNSDQITVGNFHQWDDGLAVFYIGDESWTLTEIDIIQHIEKPFYDRYKKDC